MVNCPFGEIQIGIVVLVNMFTISKRSILQASVTPCQEILET